MSNLTYQSPRSYAVSPLINIDYPVTNAKIFEGSALSDTGSVYDGHYTNGTNVVHNLVGGENFVGFAYATVDNSSGTAGSQTITVAATGIVRLAGITGLSNSSLGEWVYASDGNTFSVETSEYVSNSAIGRVLRIESVATGTALVYFQGVGFTSI